MAEFSALDLSQQALDFIGEVIPAVVATSAMLDQRALPDGTLQDVVDVGWQIIGRPGTLYAYPLAGPDWPYGAIGEIELQYQQVMAIYAGEPNQDQIVQLPPPPPPPAPAGPAQAA